MKIQLALIALLSIAHTAIASPSFQVKVTGSGTPIIFIPGLACDGSVWDETVARYSSDHQCHVLSLAGFAGTPASETNGEFFKTIETDLVHYLTENAIEKPVIVGHSLGGFLALQLAIDHPDLASQLLILDSLPFLPASMNPAATVETIQAQAAAQRDMTKQGGQNETQLRMMLQMMVTGDANFDRALQMSMRSDPATVAQAMYELNVTDLRQDVSKIKVPTTVLGAWIAYQPFGSTQESTAAIFDSQYAVLPNYQLRMSAQGKHFLMWDDPELFNAQLDAILAH